MDLVSGIAAATQAIGIAKGLRSIEQSYDVATYRSQMADLLSSLADAKLALSDARDALAERDREIERLKASFQAKSELAKGDGDYNFIADENGKPVGYPVCPRCDQVDGRIIQLKEHERSGTAKCPSCLQIYNPVTCYLPAGSGYVTKQEKEMAEWQAAAGRNSDVSYFP